MEHANATAPEAPDGGEPLYAFLLLALMALAIWGAMNVRRWRR